MRPAMVIATVALVACGGDATMDRLAGRYVMTKEWNADTLTLLDNGRYHRTFVATNKPAVVDSGVWFLTRDSKMVVLRDYPKRWAFVHDLMMDTTQGRVLTVPGTVGLTIERTVTRRFRLAWYPQFGWRYRRIGSAE